MLVELHLLVYFFEFGEDVQSQGQDFDIFEGQPVLIEFLVDPVHVDGQHLVLDREGGTCFLKRVLWDWLVLVTYSI